MNKESIKKYQEVEDFARGCTFMGTGGGGSPIEGADLIKSALDDNCSIDLIDANSFPDDKYLACPFLMGSIAPLTIEDEKKMLKEGLREITYTDILGEAVRYLENFTGKKIEALVPIELGGGNTSSCLAAAGRLNIPVINGDYTGRAIPEIPQTTIAMSKQSGMLPITSVDRWGNRVIITEAVSQAVAENIGKLVSIAGYGLSGQAGFLVKGSVMKSTIVPGTLSMCRNIGQKMREAFKSGKSSAEAAAALINGKVAHRGIVTKKEHRNEEGYYWGTNTISGSGITGGKDLSVWFKNENHVSWVDGKPWVSSPDIITIVNEITGEPMTNTMLTENMEVSVVVAPSLPVWRTEEGLKRLSARYFGFEIEWVPVEKLI